MIDSVAALLSALEDADEAITDAINDYVPCTCVGVVPGAPQPHAHGRCSTAELLTAMHAVRAALASWETRPALRDDADLACALIAVLDGQLPKATDIPDVTPLLVIVDAHCFGPRPADTTRKG